MFACIALGALIGFSLTGGAAAGTALGAATGIALLALHRRTEGGQPSASG